MRFHVLETVAILGLVSALSWAGGCTPIQIGGLESLDANAGAGSGGASAGAGARGGAAPVGGSASGGACAQRSVAIEGRVTSTRGEPLARVAVTLGGDAFRVVSADAQGHYRFDGLCPGEYSVTPSDASLRFCPESAIESILEGEVREDFSGSVAGCARSALERRVLVLVYDPVLGASKRSLSSTAGFEDPADVAERFVRSVAAISNGRVRYRVVERRVIAEFPAQIGGFRYTDASYLRCLEEPAACVPPSEADYAVIASEQGICEAVDEGSVDEVWLLGAPQFGFVPVQAPPVACRRGVDIAGFDYSRGVLSLLEAFQARSQATLSRVFADPERSLARREFSAFVHVASGAANDARSGCGSVHTPSNAAGLALGTFDGATPTSSYCDAYFEPPVAADAPARAVACSAWFCGERDYRRYWFQHLPRQAGVDSQGTLRDWWRYVVAPDDRVASGPVRCSSSYASGWCDLLTDGQYGQCNDWEWATAGNGTGWVEFSWPSPRPVRSLRIYDRACPERVVLGHVEFSDGSTPRSFGPLEGAGELPTLLEFEEKSLTGLTVFIDQSDGGPNPGFGEIIVE